MEEAKEINGKDSAPKSAEIAKSVDDSKVNSTIEKALEKGSKEGGKLIRESLEFSQIVGMSSHSLAEKLTPENINNLIGQYDKHDERVANDRNHIRKHNLYYVFGSMVFVIILLFLFIYTGNVDIIKEHIGTIISVAIAFAGGIGVGKGFYK